jgi:hypothetical protein
MNWDKIIEQTIAMLFPLIIVFLFVYYMLKSFFDQFDKQRKQELRVRFSEETLPLRLQAYERVVIYLERIKPESMIMRIATQDMTTLDLQKAMLNNIREEFDHNLSQQIYLSGEAWSMVIAAKQSMTQLVSATANDYKPDDNYIDYATDMLDEYASINDDPLSMAIKYIEKEVKEIM